MRSIKRYLFNKSLYPSLNDQYEIFDDLLSDLHNHKIEAIITDMARANETQMFSNEFSMFGIPKFYNSGFGIKKGSAPHSTTGLLRCRKWHQKMVWDFLFKWILYR